MPMTTLDYWRWKKAEASKPRLVEVAVEAEQLSPGFTVVLRNGRRIESTWAFQEPELSRLIRLLESV